MERGPKDQAQEEPSSSLSDELSDVPTSEIQQQLLDAKTSLAVALSTLQIGLLEPWLVSGQTHSYIAVDDGRTSGQLSTNARPTRIIASCWIAKTWTWSSTPLRSIGMHQWHY